MLPAMQLSIDLLLVGLTAANLQQHAECGRLMGQTERRTDTQTDGHRTVT